MPEVIETTVYRFEELAAPAQETACQNYRHDGLHYDWWDAVYEDFEMICKILGIELKTTPVRLMGGGTRQKPCIWLSGFSSQGDGACFEGWYRYAKGATKAIRSHAPLDQKLHQIADDLQAAQAPHFYKLEATIEHRGRYYHEFCMDISEDLAADPLRDLARWLYRQLETEHEYLTSDEAVGETLEANDYTFTEDGRVFH